MIKNGQIDIILGCMWSGKSTELIRQAKRYNSIGKKILIINHQSDNRYGNDIVSTHDKNKISCVSLEDLNTITKSEEYLNSEIILIDEAQFFKDLYDFVIYSADILNKTVIVVGLDGDFEKKPFGDILKLIPHCENVTKLKALCQICNDGTIASFTKRITNDSKINIIGGKEYYSAVCRYHYNHSNKLCEKNYLYNL